MDKMGMREGIESVSCCKTDLWGYYPIGNRSGYKI